MSIRGNRHERPLSDEARAAAKACAARRHVVAVARMEERADEIVGTDRVGIVEPERIGADEQLLGVLDLLEVALEGLVHLCDVFVASRLAEAFSTGGDVAWLTQGKGDRGDYGQRTGRLKGVSNEASAGG